MADSMQLDLPVHAVADVIRPIPADTAWQWAVTVVPGRGNIAYCPFAVEDGGLVPVFLFDDYVGPFEVHLHAEGGAVYVLAEGRRLPPVD